MEEGRKSRQAGARTRGPGPLQSRSSQTQSLRKALPRCYRDVSPEPRGLTVTSPYLGSPAPCPKPPLLHLKSQTSPPNTVRGFPGIAYEGRLSQGSRSCWRRLGNTREGSALTPEPLLPSGGQMEALNTVPRKVTDWALPLLSAAPLGFSRALIWEVLIGRALPCSLLCDAWLGDFCGDLGWTRFLHRALLLLGGMARAATLWELSCPSFPGPR